LPYHQEFCGHLSPFPPCWWEHTHGRGCLAKWVELWDSLLLRNTQDPFPLFLFLKCLWTRWSLYKFLSFLFPLLQSTNMRHSLNSPILHLMHRCTINKKGKDW
jgi:hypothetical protein